MIYIFTGWAFQSQLGDSSNELLLKQALPPLAFFPKIINWSYLMKPTFEDVLRSIRSWNIQSLIACKESGSKTELTYKGITRSFPHWLALRKVNQIGADIGFVEYEL
jgi:hypothetical protein